MMTTEQQIHQINGNIEIFSLNTTNDPFDTTTFNSRFFRTKRNQRLDDNNQTDINGKSTKEILINDIGKLKIRSSSPPPIALVADESDDDDDNNCSTTVNNLLTQHRSSLKTTDTGYKRIKSHSVKLTRHDENHSSPKKAVRFADDFGLQLSQMRLINTDELPFIPNEAFKHLHISQQQNSSDQKRVKVITYMEAQFENPLYTQDFNDRVSRQKIALEQANAIDNRIYGTVRLISFSLQKRVRIRVTTNNWISFQDYDATYINNSYDGVCDRFSFTLEIDRDRICIGNTIQFCICYESFDGQEYWDNNYQENYRFNCFSRTIPDYCI